MYTIICKEVCFVSSGISGFPMEKQAAATFNPRPPPPWGMGQRQITTQNLSIILNYSFLDSLFAQLLSTFNCFQGFDKFGYDSFCLFFRISLEGWELVAAFHHFAVTILEGVVWNAALRRIVRLNQVKWEKMLRMISYVSYGYGKRNITANCPQSFQLWTSPINTTWLGQLFWKYYSSTGWKCSKLYLHINILKRGHNTDSQGQLCPQWGYILNNVAWRTERKIWHQTNTS